MRLAVVILFFVLVVAGVLGYLDWRAGEDGALDGVALADADVVVFGDSVTEQSSTKINSTMPGRKVSVIGLSGLRTDQLRPVIEDNLGGADRPSVAVVMAGYNDVWQGMEREAPVEELIDVMAGVDCAIWVLIPTKGPWDHDRALAFEDRITAAAEAADVAVETRWRDAVDGLDGLGPDPELVQEDTVHPSDAGRVRVAQVMAAAVANYC